MNNLEKNKDDLLLVGTNFMVNKQGKVSECQGSGCEDCIFWKYPNTYEDSDIVECECKRMKWLLSEYKEPLSNDEITILKNISKDFNWIARSYYGWLNIFKIKPTKDAFVWGASNGDWLYLSEFNHLFQSIKWEDEEPYNIDELLKKYGVER